MDSRKFHGYSAARADIQYSSFSSIPSVPNRVVGSVKFDSRNSPNSPFWTHFDSETLTPLSDNQEQHSSTENLAQASPCNSSLNYNSYNQQQSSSSPESSQENALISSGGSTIFQSTSNGQNIKFFTLQQLETVLMAPEEEEVTTPNPSLGGNMQPQTSGQRSRAWNQETSSSQPLHSQPSLVTQVGKLAGNLHLDKGHRTLEDFFLTGIPPTNLKQLLVECARALHNNEVEIFDELVEKASGAVSITGEPIQRLGAYMVESLRARKEASGTNIYQTLRCKEPQGRDLLSYMHILYEICPYFKFGYMVANGAIAEACRNEDRIHIVDFQIAQGTQWMTLLQALAARPSGAPHVRITGIDDPVSRHARGEGLIAVGKRLAAISEKFNIPVEFHPVPVFAPSVTKEMLDIRPGEALAVNFPLQLHHTPDESVDVTNPRDGLLRMVKSLCPKVVTLVEQESNTNTAPFLPRFVETLEYYSAIFESIDVTMPRDRKERINVEMHCLARDLVNIIACEGKDRVERHELFGKWKSRFTMAGFRQYPLSSYVNSVIKGLLRCYSEHYTLIERDGAMLLGWKDRNLISASAWN